MIRERKRHLLRPCGALTALVATTALLWLALPLSEASAQGIDPKGIEAGRLRLHPGVFLETTFDSNLFFDDSTDDPVEPTNALTFRAGPSFRIVTPEPGDVDWSLSSYVSWEQYLNPSEPDSNRVLDAEILRKLGLEAVGRRPQDVGLRAHHLQHRRLDVRRHLRVLAVQSHEGNRRVRIEAQRASRSRRTATTVRSQMFTSSRSDQRSM